MPPNPTGSTYLQANSSYSWMDGDVYEIPQTDQVEGAAVNASFNGLGVDNQPHQALLNKANLLHRNQLTDEANISRLQQIAAQISSGAGANGWLSIGADDQTLGSIQLLMEWGFSDLTQYWANSPAPNSVTIAFPKPFAQAVWLIIPQFTTNAPLINFTLQFDAHNLALASFLPQGTPPLTQAVIGLNIPANTIATPSTVLPSQTRIGITGVNWIAFGM